MNVCVRGDTAGGAIQASAATTIGGIAVALHGDAVASHAPCPFPASHCAAVTTASPGTHIDGVPIVLQGDPATCGHPAVSSTGVTITPTPPDPDVRPGAPGAPVVTPAPLALEVAWGAVPLAERYLVQWRSGDEDFDASRQVVVTEPSATITGLDHATEYTVRVIATRTIAGDGPPSASVTGTPGGEEVVFSVPGSHYQAAEGSFVTWRGGLGDLPAAWFAPGADTALRYVLINGPLLGGALEIDIGSARGQNLLEDVRGTIEMVITTHHGSVTITGIGGTDTTEPYAWVPANSDELTALFNAISGLRGVAATFTFRRL